MKGIVFTEFLELVEDRFGLDTCDHILESSDLESGGAYTSVGTYDHRELVQLVGHLSEHVGVDASELVRVFGEYLFGRFVELYPAFFEDVTDGVEFLTRVEQHIHVEVKKLYPDAELPSFEYSQDGAVTSVVYRSQRAFGDLAHGLIAACLAHFGTDCELERFEEEGAGGTVVRFELTRNPQPVA